MSPTIDDLRSSLTESARSYASPDPSALLAAAVADVAADRQRRARTRLGAAAVVLVAGGALALTQGMGDTEGGPPVDPAEEQVVDDDPWLLVDGRPPEYAEGLHLVGASEIDYADTDPAVARPEVEDGTQVYAALWCTIGPALDSPAVQRPGAEVRQGEDVVQVDCAGRDGDPALAAQVALPPAEADYDVRLTGDLPREGSAVLALYEEADWVAYPFPDLTEDVAPPAVPADGITLDGATQPINQASLSEILGDDPALRQARVTVTEQTRVDLWAGEPGRLMVAVDGTVLTNDGEVLTLTSREPGQWQQADPELREGYWTAFQPEARTTLQLTPAALQAQGLDVRAGDEVVLSVHDVGFPTVNWQATVVGGQALTELQALDEPDLFPEYAHGMRLVRAVEVPADGQRRDLDLDRHTANELAWVIGCPGLDRPPAFGSGSSLTVREGDFEGTFSCQPLDSAWAQSVIPGDGFAPEAAGTEESLSVRNPATSAHSPPVWLGLYEPVEWEGYPFEESGTELFGEFDPVQDGGEVPEMGSGTEATAREVARIDSSDLDAQGRATLEVPSSQDLHVNIETTGPGRVRVEVDGTPLVWPRPGPDGSPTPPLGSPPDGWHANWSTGSAHWQLTPYLADQFSTFGTAERDTPTVTVMAEGYAEGGLEITFLEVLAPEDD